MTLSRVICWICHVVAPKEEGLAGPGLLLADHLLVELAHARAAFAQEHAVEPAISSVLGSYYCDRLRVPTRLVNRTLVARSHKISVAAGPRTRPTGTGPRACQARFRAESRVSRG